MALITFPRTSPAALQPIGLRFMLNPTEQVTPLRSGRHLSDELGPALWRGKWSMSNVPEEEVGQLRAWWATLTSAEAFYAYDALREFPVAHSGGWGDLTFVEGDGVVVLDDVTDDGLTVELSSCPDGLTLSPGDYLSFAYNFGEQQALHMVVAGSVASSGVQSVEVRPRVRPGWATSPECLVRLERATALMKIIPGTWDEDVNQHRVGRFSFDAVQVL